MSGFWEWNSDNSIDLSKSLRMTPVEYRWEGWNACLAEMQKPSPCDREGHTASTYVDGHCLRCAEIAAAVQAERERCADSLNPVLDNGYECRKVTDMQQRIRSLGPSDSLVEHELRIRDSREVPFEHEPVLTIVPSFDPPPGTHIDAVLSCRCGWKPDAHDSLTWVHWRQHVKERIAVTQAKEPQ